MTSEERKKFDSLKRWLKKYHPTDIKYKVLFTDNISEEDCADTTIYSDNSFVIHLNKNSKYPHIIDDYLHELSHVFTYTCHSYKDHPRIFWLKHGELYESFLKWLEKRNFGV